MYDYNICYSLDTKYSEQLAVSICSILKNADTKDNLNFYILDGGISEQDKLNIDLLKNIKNFNIQYIKINPENFDSYPLLRDYNDQFKDYHVTVPTYFRFKLPELLPDINKILYLDCDVIVRTSLHNLFNEDIENNSALMVLDVESDKNAQRLGLNKYFNAGVMLINLDFWRKNNIDELVLNYIKQNREKILWQDQDIINVILNETIKELPEKWNFQYLSYNEISSDRLTDADILHLSGRFKPWIISFEHPVYDIYYYYLSFTAWKYKIAEYKLICSNKKLKNNFGGSETNILKTVFDEDLKPIFAEINKTYDFTNESLTYLKKRFDEEIPKMYDYVNEALEKKVHEVSIESYDNVNLAIEKKIKEVCESIYENVNLIVEKKIKEVCDSLYDSINKSIEKKTQECFPLVYDYINKAIDKKNNELNLIYEEIHKNYKYTEKIVDDLRVELTNKQ